MNHSQAKEMRKLKGYLRSRSDNAIPFLVKFWVCASSFPLAASMDDRYPIAIALPLAAFVIVLGPWFHKWMNLNLTLSNIRKEHRDDWLLEDFSNAKSLLFDCVRIGDEWLFGWGMKRLVKIADITSLRYAPGAVSAISNRVTATLASKDSEIVLFRFYAKEPFEDELGALISYILKINPSVEVDSSLLEMDTGAFYKLFAKKLSNRSFRGTWGTCSWAIDGKGLLTVRTGTGAPCHGKSPWEDFAPTITSARFEQAVLLPRDCNGLFAGCSSLVELDCEFWNTSQVKSMKRMFSGCASLKSINGAETWDTSQVEDMTCAFDGCSSLETIFVKDWDTSSVRDMTGLFWGCSSLRYLGLKKWDTAQVEDMRDMFIGCESLVTLPVSEWDTSLTRNVDSMFKDCRSLEELDLSHWRTDKMETPRNMFEGCTRLGTLTVSQGIAGLIQGNNQVFGENKHINVCVVEP